MNLELANALNVDSLDLSARIVSSEEKKDIFLFLSWRNSNGIFEVIFTSMFSLTYSVCKNPL